MEKLNQKQNENLVKTILIKMLQEKNRTCKEKRVQQHEEV